MFVFNVNKTVNMFGFNVNKLVNMLVLNVILSNTNVLNVSSFNIWYICK